MMHATKEGDISKCLPLTCKMDLLSFFPLPMQYLKVSQDFLLWDKLKLWEQKILHTFDRGYSASVASEEPITGLANVYADAFRTGRRLLAGPKRTTQASLCRRPAPVTPFPLPRQCLPAEKLNIIILYQVFETL